MLGVRFLVKSKKFELIIFQRIMKEMSIMSKTGFGKKVLKRNIRYVLGDKCAKCGYNACEAALEVHHLIPELKKHTFGDLIGDISW